MVVPQQSIILIGPTGVGKSTIGKLLARRLNLPQISLDDVRHCYRHDFHLDADYERQLRHEDYEALLSYWQPFAAYTVERALMEYPKGIFDFGAIHSVYDDPMLLDRIATLLNPYPFVILLLPSPDPQESITVLLERGYEPGLDEQTVAMWERIIRKFVLHSSNYRLAKHTVYNQNVPPEKTVDVILAIVGTS